MAKKNEQFSRVIKYATQLDVSDVLKKVQMMRSSLAANNKNTDFLGLDKEIAKLEKLDKQLKQSLEKGFSSPQEFKDFQKITKDIGKAIQGIDTAFDQIDTTNLNTQIKDLRKKINQVKAEAKNLTEALGASLSAKLPKGYNTIVTQVKNAVKASEDYEDVQKRIGANLDEMVKKEQAAVEAAQEKVDALKQQKDLLEASKTDSSNIRFNRTSVRNIGGATIAANQKAVVQDTISKTLNANDFKTVKDAVEGVAAVLKEETLEFKNLDVLTSIVTDEYNRLATVSTQLAASNKEITSAERELEKQTKSLAETENERAAVESILNEKTTKDQYQNILKTSSSVEALEGSLVALNSQTRTSSNIYEEWRNEVSAADAATEGLIASQQALDDTFGQLSSRVQQILSIGTVYTEIRKIVRETYEDVKEIDKAFGEIAMVTSYSVADMWEQYDNYAKMANKLGQTTVGVIQASGLYYQQGMDTADALALTEDTMKLATLAGLDFSDATSQMTAALRAFHMEMSEGSHVTDVYAELAAHAAADVQGIATAMSKTASIAHSAGASFENTATFLTTMIEATQEAPDNIGTALKAVIARQYSW